MKPKIQFYFTFLLLFTACNSDPDIPEFKLDSFLYLTHNSVLLTYSNLNTVNDYPSGIRILGETESSSDTVSYVQGLFSSEENKYYAMITDLLPNTTYIISFYYAHYDMLEGEESFRTNQVDLFTDQRDGMQYPVALLGEQWWMLENLAFETSSSIVPHDSLLSGNYYSWDEALSACPVGWHLPSDEEWAALEKFVGLPDEDLYEFSVERGAVEVYKLIVPAKYSLYTGVEGFGIVNELGFSLKPTGYFPDNLVSDIPMNFGVDGLYWSSTGYNNPDAIYHGSHLKASSIHADSIKSVRMYMLKDNYLTIRCIKD